MRHAGVLALIFSLTCALGGLARASERRSVPDYDGRGKAPTTTSEVLLWGPRVLLAPPYFVSEYLLRRPLGYAIAGAERAGLPAALYGFFTFGPEHKAGIVPTGFVDFDFYPSVGFYSFWDDAGFRGHDLRLRGATWGTRWLSASLSERFRLGDGGFNQLALEASGLKRPDFVFFGLGPNASKSQRARYGRSELEARWHVDQRLWQASSLRAEVGLRSVDFHRGGFGSDALLEDSVARGALEAPGYGRGYTLAKSSLELTLDSRKPRPTSGSGVRFSTRGALASDLRAVDSFVDYGAKLGGFLDLNDRHRVVSLAVSTRFVDPLGDAEIPFTELASLGGPEAMRGFVPGRLVDRSSAVAELSYRWPIWIWLDGALRAEVGNVFGEHLHDFDPKLLRWSGAIGIESTGSTDSALELMVGVGSQTFEAGAKVDSLRFVLGTTHGF